MLHVFKGSIAALLEQMERVEKQQMHKQQEPHTLSCLRHWVTQPEAQTAKRPWESGKNTNDPAVNNHLIHKMEI